jgi:hypothetical protein
MRLRGATLRLTIGFWVSLAVCAAVPAGASACASLAGVKSFHGSAHMVFGAGAAGEDPGSGGIETVTLNRVATQLKLNLDTKEIGKKDTLFLGTVSGGTVSVGDSLNNSGDGFSGQESYDGAVKPGLGSALLAIDHRKGTCQYGLNVGYGVTTEFSGDEEVKPPSEAGATASSGRFGLPDSLKLSAGRPLPAYLDCPPDETEQVPCYVFSGGWTTDFGTLAECHSVEAVNCSSDTEPVGMATLSWSLSPTFAKKPHKKK